MPDKESKHLQPLPREFAITISSDLDYEELVAEITFQEMFVAHLRKDSTDGKFHIEWPAKILSDFQCRSCDLDQFLIAVAHAKQRLM